MVQDSNHPTTHERASTIGTGDMSAEEKRKKVGNYLILRTIGEGSFAKVRLGYHLITEMKVAVKVINKREVFKRNYLRANLRREATMMQRMSHPNIVQLHEVMETENSYYIVMDLVQGNEFVKYLTKKRQLDEGETRKFIRQVVSAVEHMHRANVVHRDLKLQNFMLNQNNDIIIIDFGLSNSLDEKGFLTTQCGSPAYAAPEIFAHQEYGPAVDVWSIGVNMYAMLLGKLPFKVENRSRNLAKLHACILRGCEIPNTLSRDCQDLLSRLLEPSPTKRITISEILRHPFLVHQLGPIELAPFKPHTDVREINRHILRYLNVKHGYVESEIEEAILYRKPIACRAIYILIERRLQEGLGWPDESYANPMHANSSSNPCVHTLADGSSDGPAVEKLDRHEPLLPGRRPAPHVIPNQTSPTTNHGQRLTRERSNFAFDEQVILRTNINGNNGTGAMTQEALNELVPPSRLTSRKVYHDPILRKSSAMGSSVDATDEPAAIRRVQIANSLGPIKSSMHVPRANHMISQQQQQPPKVKPRSLPNSTLDHANPNGFYLPHDPVSGVNNGNRTSKNASRTSHLEPSKKSPTNSPTRYNPAPSVTVKAIGLFLKNSGLHSRVSSCSSKSSKSTGGGILDAAQQSPPLRFYPISSHANANRQTVINYNSQGNLTSTTTRKPTFIKTSRSPHHLPTDKTQHPTPTGTNGQKLMPT